MIYIYQLLEKFLSYDLLQINPELFLKANRYYIIVGSLVCKL